jgi:hypothetical protein
VPHPPTAELNWWQAGLLGVVLFLAASGLSRMPARWATTVAPFLKEAGFVAVLFSLWQRAGQLSQHSSAAAYSRGRWIDEAERFVHLPSERLLQVELLDHRLLGEWANLYYAVMHLSSTGAMLLWLFWRHRGSYARVRNTLAIFTGLALLVQLISVAPPRLLPQLGFIDIGERYGQSVYAGANFSAQALLAMPSVHIGWAVTVAGAVLYAGRGRLRYVVVLHPLITLYVVTATGNHWWFDSLASLILLALVVVPQVLWSRRSGSGEPVVQPVAALA